MKETKVNVSLTLFTRSSLLTHFSQLLFPALRHLLLDGLLGPGRLPQLEPVHVPGEAGDLETVECFSPYVTI